MSRGSLYRSPILDTTVLIVQALTRLRQCVFKMNFVYGGGRVGGGGGGGEEGGGQKLHVHCPMVHLCDICQPQILIIV